MRPSAPPWPVLMIIPSTTAHGSDTSRGPSACTPLAWRSGASAPLARRPDGIGVSRRKTAITPDLPSKALSFPGGGSVCRIRPRASGTCDPNRLTTPFRPQEPRLIVSRAGAGGVLHNRPEALRTPPPSSSTPAAVPAGPPAAAAPGPPAARPRAAAVRHRLDKPTVPFRRWCRLSRRGRSRHHRRQGYSVAALTRLGRLAGADSVPGRWAGCVVFGRPSPIRSAISERARA